MRGWIIFLLVVLGLYAIHQGYLPGGEHLREVENKIKGLFPESSVLNPKEAEMRTFPVTVSYKVTVVNSKYGKYKINVKYFNHGSESVNFLMTSPVVVDPEGNTYGCSFGGGLGLATIYPGAKIVRSYYFKKLPSSGNLYIDIYIPGEQPTQLKKTETLKMRFELQNR